MPVDTFMQVLWIFPIYSFLGWCLEVVNSALYRGELVNRGFLNGSVCPIYGAGAAVLILTFSPVKDNLFLLYFGAVIAASAVEFIVGYLLKKCFHMTWWDYSQEKFNLGGYICLKVSILWGVAGVMLLRVIHPMIHYAVMEIPALVLNILLAMFYTYFTVDVVITVLSILKFNRDLREITRLSELIHKSSDAIAGGIGSATLQTVDRIRKFDLAQKAGAPKEFARQAAQGSRAKIQARLKDIEKLNALLDHNAAARARMLKALPGMKSLRDAGALLEVKRRMQSMVQRKSGKAAK